jgi:hypothetical protein
MTPDPGGRRFHFEQFATKLEVVQLARFHVPGSDEHFWVFGTGDEQKFAPESRHVASRGTVQRGKDLGETVESRPDCPNRRRRAQRSEPTSHDFEAEILKMAGLTLPANHSKPFQPYAVRTRYLAFGRRPKRYVTQINRRSNVPRCVSIVSNQNRSSSAAIPAKSSPRRVADMLGSELRISLRKAERSELGPKIHCCCAFG